MGIISHILNQGATTLVTIRNKYGDQDYSSGISESCRFREITALDKANGRESIKADALLWLEPTSTVVEGSIVRVEGRFFRVNEIIKARKFNGTVQFLKCLMEKYAEIEGVS
jgi:hypothetical protein